MKKQKKCKTPGCKNNSRPGRSFCYTCSIRKYREKYPLKYSYQTQKDNAKRRGKPFTLTFEQFCDFVIPTEYMAKKGRHSTSLHIDRIREEEGYTVGNLQVMQNADNVRKYLKWHWDEENRRMEYTVVTVKLDSDNNTPF